MFEKQALQTDKFKYGGNRQGKPSSESLMVGKPHIPKHVYPTETGRLELLVHLWPAASATIIKAKRGAQQDGVTKTHAVLLQKYESSRNSKLC